MGLYEHVEALLDVPVMNSASDAPAPALYGEERDAFLAASNLADATIGACNLLHNGPPKSYQNTWDKVQKCGSMPITTSVGI